MSGHSILLGALIGLGIGLERLQKTNKNKNTEEADNHRLEEQTQNDQREFGHVSVARRYEEAVSSGNLLIIDDFITEYEYREIREERCREIDSWEIQIPLRPGRERVFKAGNTRFVTNADESILFCHAFTTYMPNHDEEQCTYLLIVNESYYIIDFMVDIARVIDPMHQFYSVVVFEKKYINENRDELLSILKKVIAVYIKKNRREMPGEHFEYLFRYNGAGKSDIF